MDCSVSGVHAVTSAKSCRRAAWMSYFTIGTGLFITVLPPVIEINAVQWAEQGRWQHFHPILDARCWVFNSRVILLTTTTDVLLTYLQHIKIDSLSSWISWLCRQICCRSQGTSSCFPPSFLTQLCPLVTLSWKYSITQNGRILVSA